MLHFLAICHESIRWQHENSVSPSSEFATSAKEAKTVPAAFSRTVFQHGEEEGKGPTRLQQERQGK